MRDWQNRTRSNSTQYRRTSSSCSSSHTSYSGRKLYLMPQQGIIKGVCAGLAHYFGLPVRLVRVLVVISLFFGVVLTVAAYAILAFFLDKAPTSEVETDGYQPTSRQLLAQLELELEQSEQKLRQLERYVTSDTFTVRGRFRQL